MRSVLISLAFLAIVAQCVSKMPTKKLAGPASEFADHLLPSTQIGQITSQSSYLVTPFSTKMVAGNPLYSFELDLPVDSNTYFQFSFFCPAQQVELILQDPNGQQVDLTKARKADQYPIGDGTPVAVDTYSFQNPIVGTYKLTASTAVSQFDGKLSAGQEAEAHIILFTDSTIQLQSRLNDYSNLVEGRQIGLVAQVMDTSKMLGAGALKGDIITSAELDLIAPDGTKIAVQMQDDGTHFDAQANDGIYGGHATASEIGTYRAESVFRGTTPSGVKFVRTAQHLMPVVPDSVTFQATAQVIPTKNVDRVKIQINIQQTETIAQLDEQYFVYTELWGMSIQNPTESVPICWLGNVAKIERDPVTQQMSLSVELDLKWVVRADAAQPFTLKNAWAKEMDSYVPVGSIQQVSVKPMQHLERMVRYSSRNWENGTKTYTREMRFGVMPQHIAAIKANASASIGLVAVHGYCTDSNPWAPSPAFRGDHFFLEKLASMSNDDFSKLVHEFAENKQLDAYTVVGHSQGGMIGTHLLNFYWTGLDHFVDSGKRLVQSVGTPYQGCSAAGSTANLGKMFGIGCGENYQLTLDGAKTWAKDILPEVRQHIYYYTTSYKQGNLFGDYCSMAMNAILQWPNDGVTENKYATFSGANNLGNKEKWCHTVDLGYPAQYTDETRNAEMASYAP